MTNVVRLLRNCVVISSGRVTQSTFREDVGRWFHFISYIDPDGGELQDLETPTRGYARKRAQELASDMGCRVVDRSADESEAA